jgi:hypothetical protein
LSSVDELYHLDSTESTENNWFLHEFDSQNFLWDINDREGRKVPGLSVWLPFALRLADSDAALEIAIDASQMADEPALQQPDLISDSVIAKVTALAPGQRRERSLINTESATKLLDTIEARYRSVLMAARVIEMAAGPAEKLAEIEMLATLTARRTQEPRHCPLGPGH